MANLNTVLARQPIANPCGTAAPQGAVVVNPSITYQTISGWGAAILLPWSISDWVWELFYGPGGLGLTHLRIGMWYDGYRFVNAPSEDLNHGEWTPTSLDFSYCQKAVELGAKVWSVAITAPPNWKDNNSLYWGNLLQQYYPNWAQMYVQFCQNAAAEGVNIYSVSVQNEPNFDSEWVSMQWTPTDLITFVRENLGPTIESSSLALKPKIMLPCSGGHFMNAFEYVTPFENDMTTNSAGRRAVDYVGIYATHQYESWNYPLPTYRPPVPMSPGIAWWQSETCGLNFNVPFDPSITQAFNVVTEMHGALTVGMVENWHFHLVVSYFITENMGLMEFIWDDPSHAVQDAGQYAYTKRMYAFANYSKFVRPGYRRIDIGATAAGVLASAYRYAATGAVSIVAINTNASAAALPIFFTRNAPLSLTPWVTSAAYNLEAQAPVTITGNGVFNVTLPATSVTTLVGIEGQ